MEDNNQKTHQHGHFIYFLSIYLFHLILVVPILYYAGTNPEGAPGIYSALVMLTFFTLLYHGFGLFNLLWNRQLTFPGM